MGHYEYNSLTFYLIYTNDLSKTNDLYKVKKVLKSCDLYIML